MGWAVSSPDKGYRISGRDRWLTRRSGTRPLSVSFTR
jgi:hypothetical protein